MKKLLALAAAAVGAAWVYQRNRADRAEADLWAEATDTLGQDAPDRPR